MTFRLVLFIVFLILMTMFIGGNLDNRSDVNFIVYTWHDVPVFISILISFLCGAVVVLLSYLFRPRRRIVPSASVANRPAVKNDRGAHISLARQYTDHSDSSSGWNEGTDDLSQDERKSEVSRKSQTGFLRFFGLDNRQRTNSQSAVLKDSDSGFDERNSGYGKRKR